MWTPYQHPVAHICCALLTIAAGSHPSHHPTGVRRYLVVDPLTITRHTSVHNTVSHARSLATLWRLIVKPVRSHAYMSNTDLFWLRVCVHACASIIHKKLIQKKNVVQPCRRPTRMQFIPPCSQSGSTTLLAMHCHKPQQCRLIQEACQVTLKFHRSNKCLYPIFFYTATYFQI
jgi:hypothetical protein